MKNNVPGLDLAGDTADPSGKGVDTGNSEELPVSGERPQTERTSGNMFDDLLL